MSYLPRAIDKTLAEWGTAARRKPLILRGARQTGKTASVRHFGRRFELFLELNLERLEDRHLLESCGSPASLIAALAARHNVARMPSRTLLFLDEIQESPQAIKWLRFFFEDHPELHVIAAGSLMEVRLADAGFSFPVGRVSFATMRPLGFFEFLHACSKAVLAESLSEAAISGDAVPPALHHQAIELLHDYLWVGGMPEAVGNWVSACNPAAVQKVHADLWQALAEDLQRYGRTYGRTADVAHLEATFANLRYHYGLRFRYEGFAPGYQSRQMKIALGKLEDALLVARALPTSSLRLPLQGRPRSAPKLLPLDVGIATYESGLTLDSIRSLPFDSLLSGRLAESFVGQQLLLGIGHGESLHFWVSESARGNAEVDFLVPVSGAPRPVEVKSGASGSLKSLHQFLWRSGQGVGVRLHPGLFADEVHTVKMADGELRYRLISLPIYLAELVRLLPAMTG